MNSKRWMMLLLLFVARTSLAFQVQSVASVSRLLLNDLGLDLTDVGGLIGMVMLPGVIIAFPSGFVGRWWSDKVFVLSGLAMMMLGGILTGMADSYRLMALILHHDGSDGESRLSFLRASVTEKRQSMVACSA
jgi:hypothetical protein